MKKAIWNIVGAMRYSIDRAQRYQRAQTCHGCVTE
jgi:hypothetical protein